MSVYNSNRPRGPSVWTREHGYRALRPGDYDHPIQQAARNEERYAAAARRHALQEALNAIFGPPQ